MTVLLMLGIILGILAALLMGISMEVLTLALLLLLAGSLWLIGKRKGGDR